MIASEVIHESIYLFIEITLLLFTNRTDLRAAKIKFSGTCKSMLLKASSAEHCAPSNFVLLLTLGGTLIHLIMYFTVYQAETNSGTVVSTKTISLTWRF